MHTGDSWRRALQVTPVTANASPSMAAREHLIRPGPSYPSRAESVGTGRGFRSQPSLDDLARSRRPLSRRACYCVERANRHTAGSSTHVPLPTIARRNTFSYICVHNQSRACFLPGKIQIRILRMRTVITHLHSYSAVRGNEKGAMNVYTLAASLNDVPCSTEVI